MKKLYRIFILLLAATFLTTFNPKDSEVILYKNNNFFKKLYTSQTCTSGISEEFSTYVRTDITKHTYICMFSSDKRGSLRV